MMAAVNGRPAMVSLIRFDLSTPAFLAIQLVVLVHLQLQFLVRHEANVDTTDGTGHSAVDMCSGASKAYLVGIQKNLHKNDAECAECAIM